MLFFLVIFFAPLEGETSPISCYNDNGDAVDWFYLYKLPKHNDRKHAGDKYLLLERRSEEWTYGKWSVNDTNGALGRTVGPLYSQEKNTELAYILYNDDAPAEDLSYKRGGNRMGHTKGVVLIDKNQGFWLVHSTPRFPPLRQRGRFSFPLSGEKYGQNFICVTYPLSQFQTIGEQIQINQATVYDCSVPESFASVVPALADLCNKKHLPDHIFPPFKTMSNRSVTLKSKDGTNFISFAKGSAFKDDLYHSWVAPTLQSDLLVQFWIHTPHILPSNCTLDRKVLDIKLINPGQTVNFSTTQDHSKWAVSTDAASGTRGGWVCVGDINRNEAEKKRGGGTVCLQDSVVWKNYRTAAMECEGCGGGRTQC